MTGHEPDEKDAKDPTTQQRNEQPELPSSGPFSYVPLDHAARIESEIQKAIRAGEFDDLPGSGKPLSNLGGRMDPDWWIRQKIHDENLSGIGPAALSLRNEDARFDKTMDELRTEAAVREAVKEFNQRVMDARRQLHGGPPVVTNTRDEDVEVSAWLERRAARASKAGANAQNDVPPRATWRERRRAKKAGRGSPEA